MTVPSVWQVGKSLGLFLLLAVVLIVGIGVIGPMVFAMDSAIMFVALPSLFLIVGMLSYVIARAIINSIKEIYNQ